MGGSRFTLVTESLFVDGYRESYTGTLTRTSAGYPSRTCTMCTETELRCQCEGKVHANSRRREKIKARTLEENSEVIALFQL